jgi:hypothetical protein
MKAVTFLGSLRCVRSRIFTASGVRLERNTGKQAVADALGLAEDAHARLLVVEHVRLRLLCHDHGEELVVSVLDLVAQVDEELNVAPHGVVLVGVLGGEAVRESQVFGSPSMRTSRRPFQWRKSMPSRSRRACSSRAMPGACGR